MLPTPRVVTNEPGSGRGAVVGLRSERVSQLPQELLTLLGPLLLQFPRLPPWLVLGSLPRRQMPALPFEFRLAATEPILQRPALHEQSSLGLLLTFHECKFTLRDGLAQFLKFRGEASLLLCQLASLPFQRRLGLLLACDLRV